MTLFLAWFDEPDAEIRPALAEGEQFTTLAPRLHLVESGRSRSRLYHAIKHTLPADTALLLAPLAEDPKFKGLAPGSLAWLRDRTKID